MAAYVLAGKGPPFSFDTGRHAYLPWGRAALHASACVSTQATYGQRASQRKGCAVKPLTAHLSCGMSSASIICSAAAAPSHDDSHSETFLRSPSFQQYRCALYCRVNRDVL
jgi:hypothetical protein